MMPATDFREHVLDVLEQLNNAQLDVIVAGPGPFYYGVRSVRRFADRLLIELDERPLRRRFVRERRREGIVDDEGDLP
jgi:hypothetical protein